MKAGIQELLDELKKFDSDLTADSVDMFKAAIRLLAKE